MNTLNTSKIAQNTFSDGLIMDFNDLLVPSSAYTNCLNGTCITYNGNEFVLQNDMGNGRVETAYLPAGYVPVGVKEYGGIIYIASVNPLTNECQLGSFPSPVEDTYGADNIGNGNILTMSNSDGKLVHKQLALGDNNLLSVGDKFALSLQGMLLDDAKKLISHCFNVTDGESKIKTPKNKTFTLQLMVENSDHHLIDITSLLTRYNNNGGQITTENYLSEQGYFLAFTNQESGNAASSVNTFILQIEESKYEQIYKGKVGGNLYIVCTINAVSKYQAQWIDLQNEKIKDTNSESDDANASKVRTLYTLDYGGQISPDDLIIQTNHGDPELDPTTPIDENPQLGSLEPEITFENNENGKVYIKILDVGNPAQIIVRCTIQFDNSEEEFFLFNYNNNQNDLHLSQVTGLRDTVYDDTDHIFYLLLQSVPEASNLLQNASTVTLNWIQIACNYSNSTVALYNSTTDQNFSSQSLTHNNNKSWRLTPINVCKTTLDWNLLYSSTLLLWTARVNAGAFFYSRITPYYQSTPNASYFVKRLVSNDENLEYTREYTVDGVDYYENGYIIDDTAYNDVFGLSSNLALTSITVSLISIISDDSFLGKDIDVGTPIVYKGDSTPIEWTRENYDTFRDPLPYKFVRKQETFNPETLEELTLYKQLFYDGNGINISPSDVLLVVNTKRQFSQEQKVFVYIYTSNRDYTTAYLTKYVGTYNNEFWYYLNLSNSELRKGNIYLGIDVEMFRISLTKTDWMLIPAIDYSGLYKPTGTLLLNYYYNCPDGIYSNKIITQTEIINGEETQTTVTGPDYLDSTDKYERVHGKSDDFYNDPTLLGTRLYLNIEGDSTLKIEDISLPTYNDKGGLPTYDEQTNLYHLEQEVNYDFSHLLNNDLGYSFESLPNITYKAYPFLNFGLGEMEDLVLLGTIEFKKVGTGDLLLSAWKYYWDPILLEVTITWGLNNYLRTTLNILLIRFNCYLLHSNQTFDNPIVLTPEPKSYYSGTFTDLFSLEDDLFIDNSMYLVQIQASLIENNETSNVIIGYRWILTSGLYNSSFEDPKILDFASKDLYTSSNIDNARTVKFTIVPTPIQGEITKENTIEYVNSSSGEATELLVFTSIGDSNKFPTTANINATVKEEITDNVDIRYQLSWDIEGLPINGITYNKIEGLFRMPEWNFAGANNAEEEIIETTNSSESSITSKFKLSITSQKEYSGLKLTEHTLISNSIPVYRWYRDYKRLEKMPGMLVYGYCHDGNDRDAYTRIEVFRADGEREFYNSYITRNAADFKSLVQYDPSDLGQDNQNIIQDVVGPIIGITDTAEGFYINWGLGLALHNQTQKGYENLFIFMLRCDDGQEGTPKYVAASNKLYVIPPDYKFTTIWDWTCPDLANALIKLPDETAESTFYVRSVKSMPEPDSYQVTPLVTICANVSEVEFSRLGPDVLDTVPYNTMIQTCKNKASLILEKTEDFDYIWDKLLLLYPNENTVTKTITLDPVTFTGSELLSKLGAVDKLSQVKINDTKSFFTLDIVDPSIVYKYENGIIKEAPNILKVGSSILRVKPSTNKEYIPFLSIGQDEVHKITNTRSYKDLSWLKGAIGAVTLIPGMGSTVDNLTGGNLSFNITSAEDVIPSPYRFANVSSIVGYIDPHTDIKAENRGGFPYTGYKRFWETAGTLTVDRPKAKIFIELGHIHT